MNFSGIYIALVLCTGMFSNTISRAEYYPVFKGESRSQMELMVNQLEQTKQQKAYLGALKMKLSGLQKGPSTKLKTFKEGRGLLEAEITNEPENLEWRFLRLAIQENAPKILKYSQNLSEDKAYISSHFNSTPIDLQKIIINYSTNSSILQKSDFK